MATLEEKKRAARTPPPIKRDALKTPTENRPKTPLADAKAKLRSATGVPTPETDPVKDRMNKISLYILTLTIFFGSAMYTIVLPSLPQYLTQLGIGDDPAEAKTKALYLGYMVSAFSLGMFISSPILGFWYNKRHGMESLVFSGILLLVGNVAYAVVPNANWLIGARFVIGLGAGNVTICRAFAAQATNDANRVGVFAMMSAAQGVGLVVGPGIASVLAPIDFHVDKYYINQCTAPGWLFAILTIVNIILLVIFYREYPGMRLKNDVSEELKKEEKEREKVLLKQVDKVAVVICIIDFFLITFNFAIFETIVAQITQAVPYNFTAKDTGIMFVVSGAVSVISFMVIKPLNKHCISERKFFIVGLVIMMAAGAICINTKPVPLPVLLVGVALFSIGFPFSSAIIYALFSLVLGNVKQGTLMGYFQSSGSVARTVGPLWASLMYGLHGNLGVFSSIAAVSGATALLSLVFMPRMVSFEERKKKMDAQREQQPLLGTTSTVTN